MYLSEKGNARVITNVCFPTTKIMMLRYESIVEVCMNEPVNIFITKKENEEKLFCEPIYKIIVEFHGLYTKCYTLYSDKREHFGKKNCFLLRRIMWDCEKDKEHVQSLNTEKEKMLSLWPTMKAENLFMPYEQAQIVKELKKMDKLINKGIPSNICSKKKNDWTNIELRRRFNWGETRSCWDCTRQIQQVEDLIFETVNLYDDMLHKIQENESIEKIELDYMVPLEIQKGFICGEIE